MAIILSDMDGVLADFESRVFDILEKMGGPKRDEVDPVPFKIAERVGKEWSSTVFDIITKENFFAELEPLEGALEALKEMEEAGHQVWICTSPLLRNPTCASEKLAWVEKHLGKKWMGRTIITSDKTLVNGDVLIDDKAFITGEQTPPWAHILYDQVPQRETSAKVRMQKWASWREALEEAIKNP